MSRKIVVYVYRLPRHCEERSDVAIPRLEGKCIENCPKIYGIATPVCALVRNDVLLFSTLNNNLSYKLSSMIWAVRAEIS